MLRKHIKIEPLRWYYHCDRLGMLVWQDMISGGGIYSMSAIALVPGIDLFLNTKISRRDDTEKNYGFFAREDKQGRDEYYEDSERMVNLLYNAVSIALWVPFNEGWGQFDALKAEEFYRKLDPTRLIDHASGWHDQGSGDFKSMHIYKWKIKVPSKRKLKNRAFIVSECGAYILDKRLKDAKKKKGFIYLLFNNKEDYQKEYERFINEEIKPNVSKGLSGFIYTQLSDVEEEMNGFISYDRKEIKVDIDKINTINNF